MKKIMPPELYNGPHHTGLNPVRAMEEQGETTVSPAAIVGDILYRLPPVLLNIFSKLNVTDKLYTSGEAMVLLVNYLKLNNLLVGQYAICDAPLKEVFGVDNFHYSSASKLMGRLVIRVNTNEDVKDSANRIQMSPVAVVPSPVNYLMPQMQSNSTQPSSSRDTVVGSHPLGGVTFIQPEIPNYVSDTETEYSFQGYETTLCHNTEPSATESEIETDFEEYELASISDEGGGEIFSDDSDVDDIKLAVVGVATMHMLQEASDDAVEDAGFYADVDYSSSDDTSDDESVDVHENSEQQTCMNCECPVSGNHTFFRLCDQCWQLRKNSYPERPKKRRKPRPKDRKQRRLSEHLSLLSQNELLQLASGSEPVTTQTCPLSCASASSGSDSGASSCTSISSQDSGIEVNSDKFQNSQDSGNDLSEPVVASCKRRNSSPQPPSCKRICENRIPLVKSVKAKITEIMNSYDGMAWLDSLEGHQWVNETHARLDPLNLCCVCLERPKNAVIVHGKVSHQVTCWKCAQRLHAQGKKCPGCRRKIHMVTRNIIM